MLFVQCLLLLSAIGAAYSWGVYTLDETQRRNFEETKGLFHAPIIQNPKLLFSASVYYLPVVLSGSLGKVLRGETAMVSTLFVLGLLVLPPALSIPYMLLKVRRAGLPTRIMISQILMWIGVLWLMLILS